MTPGSPRIPDPPVRGLIQRAVNEEVNGTFGRSLSGSMRTNMGEAVVMCVGGAVFDAVNWTVYGVMPAEVVREPR